MLPKGPAKRVTIYLNEDTRHHLEPLWSAIVAFLRHKMVAGASVTRPSLGFGSHHRLHTLDTEATMAHLPVRVEFVETPERVDQLLPTLYDMVSDGLIEVQDTVVLKSIQKGKHAEPARPHAAMSGKAKLVRIFLGEGDKLDGEPLFEAMVKRLRMMDVAGATVYRGILGYGAKGETHKGGWFSRDLPIMISIVEEEARLPALLDAVEAMLQDGLIVISDVEVLRLIHKSPEPESRSTKPS